MTLDDIPVPMRECLATFEALRRCGFSSDNIYFTLAINFHTRRPHLAIQLQAQARTFTVNCGELDAEGDELRDLWQASAKWWNGEATEELRKQLWEASHVYENKVDFLAGLLGNGFRLPKNWS